MNSGGGGIDVYAVEFAHHLALGWCRCPPVFACSVCGGRKRLQLASDDSHFAGRADSDRHATAGDPANDDGYVLADRYFVPDFPADDQHFGFLPAALFHITHRSRATCGFDPCGFVFACDESNKCPIANL